MTDLFAELLRNNLARKGWSITPDKLCGFVVERGAVSVPCRNETNAITVCGMLDELADERADLETAGLFSPHRDNREEQPLNLAAE